MISLIFPMQTLFPEALFLDGIELLKCQELTCTTTRQKYAKYHDEVICIYTTNTRSDDEDKGAPVSY